LAVRVRKLAGEQPEQTIRRTGPAVSASYDASGQPTKAALGFAASCGVPFATLAQVDGPKGKVLLFETKRAGDQTVALLPSIVQQSLHELPIAKRMRWGAGTAEFVRPVHWLVMLFGKDVVDAEILGIRSGRETRGHRFHSPKPLNLTSPAAYVQTLKTRGFVLADIEERRERIKQGALDAAQNTGGAAVIDPSLLDEVTALVEWPVPLAGRFDERFLALPAEVPVATMQDHQRYFPVRDAQGKLLATFIAVANIASKDPDKVRAGNERVIRPRLADAAFFWEADRKQTLASRRDALKNITFQAQLGSYFDKVERITGLSALITQALRTSAHDALAAHRAAELCKCDLLSLLVGEFPELQGTMGKYYAQHDGESGDVALALEEHYLPRFAGEALPTTLSGSVVAIADKLDTIVGIFAIGQKPSGTKDPFALRRAALGVLRLILEQRHDLNLVDLIRAALNQLPSGLQNEQTVTDVYDYMMERLRAYYLESATTAAITTEMFDAVLANRPSHPLDFDARLKALSEFIALPDAGALAAANKRIANILRKSNATATQAFSAALAEQNEERNLHEAIEALRAGVERSLDERDYSAALIRLASLRPAVDAFFDKVMVMADNPTIRDNRLALLGALRGLFSSTADLSRLPG
jgi:glycyl-tRNA synthetase beta chain